MPGGRLLLFCPGEETREDTTLRRESFLLRERRASYGRSLLPRIAVVCLLEVSCGAGLSKGEAVPVMLCDDLLKQHRNSGRCIVRVEGDQHFTCQRLGGNGVDSFFLREPFLDQALERLRMIEARDLIPHSSRHSRMDCLYHRVFSPV